MKSTEITTAHNIVLSFELAGISLRILAFCLDMIIVIIYSMLIGFAVGSSEVLSYIFILPVYFFYQLTCEIFNKGQSIGKHVAKIRVISLDGKDISLKSLFLRWSFRLIDIGATLGLLAMLSIFSSELGQRIGDVLANTIVVRLDPKSKYSLESLEKLDQKEHRITYPEVVRYTDQDMLLVKKMLKRLQKTRNEKTKLAAKELSLRLLDQLEIKDRKISPSTFLSTVLRDYIVLTR